jgi:hypothetical protein
MIEYQVQVDDNSTTWRLNGQRHRVDGPAVESANGHKMWYHHGQQHREDGPAVEYVNGNKEWYINDRLHRKDGPAIEWADGNKDWYINGKKVTEGKVMKPVKQLTVAQIEVLLGHKIKVIAG